MAMVVWQPPVVRWFSMFSIRTRGNPRRSCEVVDASMTALEAAAELAPPDASTLQKAPLPAAICRDGPTHRIFEDFLSRD